MNDAERNRKLFEKTPVCAKHNEKKFYIYVGSGHYEWWCNSCVSEETK